MTAKSQTTAEQYYLEKRIEDCKQVLKQTGETQKEKIKEWAESLERLHQLGKSNVPPNRISGHIQTIGRNEFGWTDGQCAYVTDILDKRFKDSTHNPLTSSVNRGLENLNIEENLEKFAHRDILINIGLKNPDKLSTINEIARTITNLSSSVGDSLNIPGIRSIDHVERERKKISTPEPKPGESNMHYTGAQIYDSLLNLTQNWKILVEKINQYPTTDPKFDIKTAGLLIRF
jgi:hypothetical protein